MLLSGCDLPHDKHNLTDVSETGLCLGRDSVLCGAAARRVFTLSQLDVARCIFRPGVNPRRLDWCQGAGRCWFAWRAGMMAYKFEQEGVLSEGADAAGEAQDEHDPADDDEEPHGVEASQVGDG